MMRSKLLVLLICLFSLKAGAQIFNVDTVAYNGNPNNRINLVIMGDGYTSGEMSTFRSDAQLVANYFFSVPPFSLYPDFFNVFAIEVVSNESGNDHPETAIDCPGASQPVTAVDNYLGTTFDYSGIHRCIYSSQGSLVYSIANDNVPLYDYVNVIVNTSYYGGCAGGIAYTSMNSSSPEVFVHEFGHMFGDLSDEYENSDPCTAGSTQYINVTQVTNPATIVWKNWLTTAPMPTPAGTNCSLIGAYEGAEYCTTNWYRPKCNCKMRSLNQPFCEVCFEQLIYKISTMVNYIQSFIPSNSLTLPLCKNATMAFSADVLNSTNNTVRSQWLVDNVVVVNNNVNFTLDPSTLSLGTHQVKLITSDTTAFSKKTMNSYQVSWTVNVLAAPAAVASSNASTFCTGQTLNLSSSGVGTFSWTGPNSYSSNLPNPSISGLDSSRTGIYTLTATNSCGTSTSSVNITVSSSINSAIVAQGPTSFCDGNSVVLAAGANASYSYQWYENAVPIGGASSNEFTVFQSGNYTVRVSITATACSTTSAPVTVTVSPIPTANISTGDPTTFCDGSSALLSAQTGAGYSYQWLRNNQAIVPATNSQWNALVTGNHKVVTTLGSCRDTSSGISILVNPNPASTLGITGDTIFCVGGQVNLTVPSCGTCTYQWQRDLTDSTGATSNTLIVSDKGTYHVEIINTGSNCFAISRDVYIDVHDMPSATITANGSPTFCEGDSIVLSVASVSTNSYAWYRDAQFLPGSASADLIVGNSGSYTVIVSDIVCSTQSDPFLITVYPNPVTSMNSLPDTLCIYNASIELTGNPAGGIFSGDGVVDSIFNPSLAGAGLHTVSYLFIDSNGCSDLIVNSIFIDICLSSKGPDKSGDFIIFPNPVSGIATIHYSVSASSDIEFTLMDLTGRLIEKFILSQGRVGEKSFSLHTDHYNAGVYFLTMRWSGRELVKKLLVEN